jgi:sortase A
MSRQTRTVAWLLDAVAVGLALVFVLLAGRTLFLSAKGALAEHLIARAFAAHVRDGGDHLPWGWADVHPVASLEVPRLGVRRHILTGASGTSMAFGIGHVDGTASPNNPGNCVLAGHRDTRFAFLEDVRVGDEVILTTRGEVRTWEVEGVAVVDDTRVDLLEATSSSHLTLITCYPFDGLTPGAQRYVVWCRPQGGQPQRGPSAAQVLLYAVTS